MLLRSHTVAAHWQPHACCCYNPPRRGFAEFLAYSYSGAN
jgi:hypothetical protein